MGSSAPFSVIDGADSLGHFCRRANGSSGISASDIPATRCLADEWSDGPCQYPADPPNPADLAMFAVDASGGLLIQAG
jgi:hypothetical protein